MAISVRDVVALWLLLQHRLQGRTTTVMIVPASAYPLPCELPLIINIPRIHGIILAHLIGDAPD